MPVNNLVADDEPMVCQLTCRILQEAGYQVEGVYSGGAALGFLRHRRYDLFVLDVRLMDMSGFTLAHLIADQHPDSLFLFVSGYPQSHGVEPPAPTDISNA